MRRTPPTPTDAELFAELLASPGVEEDVSIGSRVGVMAYHGGNLEAWTDAIADEVAARTGASLYAVRQPETMRWHLPSRHVRPEESERLATFLDHVDVVLTIHGYGRWGMFQSILLGGRNRSFAATVAGHLRTHLANYEIIDRLDDIPKPLRGQHRENPVNRPRLAGVQIELPPRVRGGGPFWNAWRGLGPGGATPHTDRLVDGLVAAVEDWSATA